MSNYYKRRNQAANMAETIMARGWNVGGYKPDRSDSMTDYYDPASWHGAATHPASGASLWIRFARDGEMVPKGKAWALYAADGRRLTCGGFPNADRYSAVGRAAFHELAERIEALASGVKPSGVASRAVRVAAKALRMSTVAAALDFNGLESLAPPHRLTADKILGRCVDRNTAYLFGRDYARSIGEAADRIIERGIKAVRTVGA
jgi:hypothetical protein